MDEFKEQVLFGEHITQEDIRHIGKSIAKEILRRRNMDLEPSMQEHLILSLLEPHHMMRLIYTMNTAGTYDDLESIPEEELKKFLAHIQEAIVEEIKKTIDLNDPLFHFISHPHPHARTIFYLKDKKVHKDYRYEQRRDVVVRNTAALETLYALKERSPHILYNLLYKDPKSGHEIQAYHDIDTLEKYTHFHYTHSSSTENFNPLPALYAFRDAVRGAKFLFENGLIITDLSADNIGINNKTNSGYLFDFDGLIQLGETPNLYITKTSPHQPNESKYCPPEFLKRGCKAHEGFPVYELGATLEELTPLLLQSPVFASNRSIVPILDSFERLIDAMREPNPDHRLTLEAVEMKLTDLYQKLETILQEASSASKPEQKA